MTIDWFTLVAQIVNFLILIWLLQRFLYAPVMRAMAEREAQISQRFADADAAQVRADASLQDYQQQQQELAQAKETLLARAGCDVDAWRQEQLQQARAEIDEDRRQWREELTREKQSLLRELQLDVTQHAVDLGRQVLVQLADQPLESRLVDRLIEQIRSTELNSLLRPDGSAASSLLVVSSHELPADERSRIADVLQRPDSAIEFQADPQLICGIELQTPECRVSWNMRETLAEIESDLIDAIEETLPHGQEPFGSQERATEATTL